MGGVWPHQRFCKSRLDDRSLARAVEFLTIQTLILPAGIIAWYSARCT